MASFDNGLGKSVYLKPLFTFFITFTLSVHWNFTKYYSTATAWDRSSWYMPKLDSKFTTGAGQMMSLEDAIKATAYYFLRGSKWVHFQT